MYEGFLRALQIYRTDETVEAMFKVLDTDKDGQLRWPALAAIVFPEQQKKRIKIRQKNTSLLLRPDTSFPLTDIHEQLDDTQQHPDTLETSAKRKNLSILKKRPTTSTSTSAKMTDESAATAGQSDVSASAGQPMIVYEYILPKTEEEDEVVVQGGASSPAQEVRGGAHRQRQNATARRSTLESTLLALNPFKSSRAPPQQGSNNVAEEDHDHGDGERGSGERGSGEVISRPGEDVSDVNNIRVRFQESVATPPLEVQVEDVDEDEDNNEDDVSTDGSTGSRSVTSSVEENHDEMMDGEPADPYDVDALD